MKTPDIVPGIVLTGIPDALAIALAQALAAKDHYLSPIGLASFGGSVTISIDDKKEIVADEPTPLQVARSIASMPGYYPIVLDVTGQIYPLCLECYADCIIPSTTDPQSLAGIIGLLKRKESLSNVAVANMEKITSIEAAVQRLRNSTDLKGQFFDCS